MVKVFNLQQAQDEPKGQVKNWLYNGLDTTGTLEVWETLRPRLSPAQERTYSFERALQAPAMSMMMRGVRIDRNLRTKKVTELKREVKKEMRGLGKLPQVTEVWDVYEKDAGDCKLAPARSDGSPGKHKWPRGVPDSLTKTCERCGTPRLKLKTFNPGSSDQKKHLFFDLHHIPPMTNKLGKISTNDDVLERIGRRYPKLYPLTEAIRELQDKLKQVGTLSARTTYDDRYPSSFNVGAAWTGRFSSSENPFGMGGNLQNVTERHKAVFIPDVGMDIGYADYMQGESNIVAHLSGDEKYIEAHALGDVHTYVCRLIWPELPWTGDLKKDKAVAKALPPWDQVEGHDYRFQSKRIQHGSNFGLTPRGISYIAHIPEAQAERAQGNFFSEFDGIPAWQSVVKERVQNQCPLVNPLGRTITLMGRPWDKHTWRQGYAFLPQSTLADVMNIALWRVWHELEGQRVLLLAQVHDALLVELPREALELLRAMLTLMRIPVPVTDIHGVTRTMIIGVEAGIGRNWGKKKDANLLGLDEDKVAAFLKDHPIS